MVFYVILNQIGVHYGLERGHPQPGSRWRHYNVAGGLPAEEQQQQHGIQQAQLDKQRSCMLSTILTIVLIGGASVVITHMLTHGRRGRKWGGKGNATRRGNTPEVSATIR